MNSAISWQNIHPLIDEARVMAQRLLRCERNAHSLQTTALVLTALRRQKLVSQDWHEVSWANREQFLAAMYRAMDRALIDHGRRRTAKKVKARTMLSLDDLSKEELLRTADFQPHELKADGVLGDHPELIETLVAALADLEEKYPQYARVAKHRYYGGLTVDQTARLMDISERTVRRHWEKARILLHDSILQTLRGA